MKLDININDNTLYISLFACATITISSIVFALWDYNIKAVKHYTKHHYEQVSDKRTSKTYCRKAR